jgi:iron complex outermembrane recepter protein
MKKIVSLFIVSLVCSVAIAQQKGIVLNTQNEALAGVDILVVPLGVILQTDTHGEFHLESVLPPNAVLVFSKEGYQTQSYKMPEGNDYLRLIMETLHIEINEVEVSAINHQLSSNQSINLRSKSLNRLSESASGLVESVSQISGVEQLSTGAGINKLVVRGLSGMRVVTYLNGARIENQQWGGDHGIGFTDLGIGKVELVKGPASIMFGADALGGAIYFVDESYVSSGQSEVKVFSHFESALMRYNNQLHAKWAKNNFRINAYAEYGSAADYKLPNGNFLFNSRYSNLAFKTAVGYSKNSWLMNMRYQYNYNVLGIPAHSHDDEPTLDQLSISSQNRYETRPTQFVSNHMFLLHNTFFINSSTLKVDVINSNNRLQEFEAWTLTEMDVVLNSNQFNTTFIKPINTRLTWTMGNQNAFQTNRNKPARSELLPDAEIQDFGIFSNIDYTKNNWSFLFGIRFDNREIETVSNSYSKGFNALSSSVGFSKSIAAHRLRLSYSSAFRTPHFSELLANGVHHGTQRYEIGNSNLKEEKGNQIDMTYEWSNEHLGIIINPFFHQINDFIALNPQDSVIDGTPLYLYQQEDNVHLKGLEMNIHYHPHFLHQLHFEESISIIDGQTSNKAYLPLMPANKFQSKIRYYFTNKNRLKCRDFSVDYVYYTAQNKVGANETPSSAYGLVHTAFNFASDNKNLDLSIGVKNLLNQSYIPHLSRLKTYEIPNVGRSYYIKFCLTL